MRPILLVALAGLIFAVGSAASASESYAPLTKPLRVEQVPGKPIFYSLGISGVPSKANEGNTSNAGFVITSEGVVVFDALGTPSLGWALLQKIKSVTDKPIKYVVASHYHADHIYGLQAFKDNTDAAVVAQDRASEYQDTGEIADERADQRLDQRRGALFPWVDEKTRVVPPTLTFNDRMAIHLGEKTFQLIYAGPAHSSSDAMMVVEPDGVLFAGDIVQNGRIPFMNSDDVDTSRWLHSLDLVKMLHPRYIIPGHGKPSTQAAEAISFTQDYIQYVRSAMSKAVKSWTDFATAYEQTDWSKYRNLPAFNSINRGNAYRVFLELEKSGFERTVPNAEK